MNRMELGSARVSGSWLRNGAVAQSVVSGMLTPGVLPPVRAHTLNGQVLAGAQSLVLRLDGATIAASIEDYAPTDVGITQQSTALPVAIVVAPAYLDTFRRHAWELSLRGMVRGVFLPIELDAAYEWAERMARLRLVPAAAGSLATQAR